MSILNMYAEVPLNVKQAFLKYVHAHDSNNPLLTHPNRSQQQEIHTHYTYLRMNIY